LESVKKIFDLPSVIENSIIAVQFKLYNRGGKTAARGKNAVRVNIDMARIRIFVTLVRVQHRVKTKLRDKQVLSTLRVVTLLRS